MGLVETELQRRFVVPRTVNLENLYSHLSQLSVGVHAVIYCTGTSISVVRFAASPGAQCVSRNTNKTDDHLRRFYEAEKSSLL